MNIWIMNIPCYISCFYYDEIVIQRCLKFVTDVEYGKPENQFKTSICGDAQYPDFGMRFLPNWYVFVVFCISATKLMETRQISLLL